MTTLHDVISGRMVTVAAGATVADAARMLDAEDISHLLVVDDARLVGVLCACDIELEAPDTRVAQAMSERPATIEAGMTPKAAVTRMLALGVSCLPVVRHGELSGIVTFRELMQLGFAEDAVERCSACGGTDHVRCAEHGQAFGFCLDCRRRSEPPAWDDELGGG